MGIPGLHPDLRFREANAMRGDPAARGQLYLGTKGSLALSGGYEVFPEMKIDPVNDIPPFQGIPSAVPVYSKPKPEPWIQPPRAACPRTPATAPAAKTPWP